MGDFCIFVTVLGMAGNKVPILTGVEERREVPGSWLARGATSFVRPVWGLSSLQAPAQLFPSQLLVQMVGKRLLLQAVSLLSSLLGHRERVQVSAVGSQAPVLLAGFSQQPLELSLPPRASATHPANTSYSAVML